MQLTPGIAPQMEMEFEKVIYPSRTYALDGQKMRIRGDVDGLEALRQAVDKALRTERFRYMVYTANYGVELEDKLGMPVSLSLPEIKRSIIEALTWDSRIERVDGFEFEVDGGRVRVFFHVHSIYGELEGETEVGI